MEQLVTLNLTQLPPRPLSNLFSTPNQISFQNYPPLTNQRLLQAARGQPTDKIPVWVMRQAGRYLPQFRDLRSQHQFFQMCTTPHLATQVTLMPILRFQLDAAIIFSDILVIPQAMGLQVVMQPGVGPVFPSPLISVQQIETLKFPDLSTDYQPYFDALHLTRHSLKGKVPLIGFSGGPFTLFTYMTEGKGSNTFAKSRKWLYAHPQESHKVLDLLSRVLIEFLIGQVCSGAQALQVFQSHAGLLGKESFQEFLMPYIVRVGDALKESVPHVPLIIFCKDAGWAVEKLCQTSYDVIGLDWTVDPVQAKVISEKYGKSLQGNLDPAFLYGSKEFVQEKTREMKEKFGEGRYIANLGHGIYPDMDPEHLEVFVNTVHAQLVMKSL